MVVVPGSRVLYSIMWGVCDEACCVHRRCCTKFVVKSWDGGMFKKGVTNTNYWITHVICKWHIPTLNINIQPLTSENFCSINEKADIP